MKTRIIAAACASLFALAAMAVTCHSEAQEETAPLRVYAAGSTRGVLAAIADDYTKATGLSTDPARAGLSPMRHPFRTNATDIARRAELVLAYHNAGGYQNGVSKTRMTARKIKSSIYFDLI